MKYTIYEKKYTIHGCYVLLVGSIRDSACVWCLIQYLVHEFLKDQFFRIFIEIVVHLFSFYARTGVLQNVYLGRVNADEIAHIADGIVDTM